MHHSVDNDDGTWNKKKMVLKQPSLAAPHKILKFITITLDMKNKTAPLASPLQRVLYSYIIIGYLFTQSLCCVSYKYLYTYMLIVLQTIYGYIFIHCHVFTHFVHKLFIFHFFDRGILYTVFLYGYKDRGYVL